MVMAKEISVSSLYLKNWCTLFTYSIQFIVFVWLEILQAISRNYFLLRPSCSHTDAAPLCRTFAECELLINCSWPHTIPQHGSAPPLHARDQTVELERGNLFSHSSETLLQKVREQTKLLPSAVHVAC